MNVAFEQIRRTFEVPKPVMHLIVHHVRPRAPPPPAEWHTRREGGWLFFGSWSASRGMVMHRGAGLYDFYCPHCMAGPLAGNHYVCAECLHALYFLARQEEE
jgi:hypothetical protein